MPHTSPYYLIFDLQLAKEDIIDVKWDSFGAPTQARHFDLLSFIGTIYILLLIITIVAIISNISNIFFLFHNKQYKLIININYRK